MHDRTLILAATDLAALADEQLGPRAGSAGHPMWPCPNPHHEQTGRTPPVSVFTSRWDEQRWHCHGCGDGGTAIDLVMRTRGIGVGEAIRELATRAGIGRLKGSSALRQSQRSGGAIPPVERRAEISPDQQAGVQRYVDACANELWSPSGRQVRQWLMEVRQLPESVLRTNHIGADVGRPDTYWPDGLVHVGAAAILPVHQDGGATYFQARVLQPSPDRARYLNPRTTVAPNPKLSHIEPSELLHPEVIVTEGTIDALSAACAGYRSVAILSAGYPDRSVAHQLAQLEGRLVIAMDNDSAGESGARVLAQHLRTVQRPASVLSLAAGDLNESMQRTPDWPADLRQRVDDAWNRTPLHRSLEVG